MADADDNEQNLKTSFFSNHYQRDRKEAYSHLNQFELQYDDMLDGGTRWGDAIQAIKDKFPKPE